MSKPKSESPAMAERSPLLVNEADAATMLAISPRSVWTLRNTGMIPYVRIGSSIRYRVADLEAFITQRLSTTRGAPR